MVALLIRGLFVFFALALLIAAVIAYPFVSLAMTAIEHWRLLASVMVVGSAILVPGIWIAMLRDRVSSRRYFESERARLAKLGLPQKMRPLSGQ